MAIPAILGRRFDVPTINLGFSGNGKMDPEMASLLAELDPAVYCIDCLPNMNPDLVRQRAADFVRTLARRHAPTTPILLVEDRVFTNARFFPDKQKFHRENHQALREAYEPLQKDGVPACITWKATICWAATAKGPPTARIPTTWDSSATPTLTRPCCERF